MSTPSDAMARFDALKARELDLLDPDHILFAAIVSVVRALVEAQPQVANSGSGAAPDAPQPASVSASLTPDAAGTAPEQPQAQS